MKKIIVFLLTLSLLLATSVSISAETAASDVTISYNSNDAKLSSDFVVTVSVANNQTENFYGGEFVLSYDNTKLELSSVVTDFSDVCPWEIEVLYSTENSKYITAFADLSSVSSSNVADCGVKPGDTIDFQITFKAIDGGDAAVSVSDVIFLKGEFLSDIDLEGVETTISVAYPAKISTVSLVVGSGIKLSFSALIPDEYKGAQICFTQPYTNGSAEIAPITYAEGTLTGSTGNLNGEVVPKYDFIAEVNPDRLNDAVFAYLIYDGVVISKTINYSVINYCNYMYQYAGLIFSGEQYTSLMTLLDDLLVYGAAAQAYTGYNADAPVTDFVLSTHTLAPSEFVPVTESDLKSIKTDVTNLRFSTIGLSLGSNFWLAYKVKATSIENAKIKVSVNTGDSKYYYYLEPDFLVPTENEGEYYLNLKPVAKGVDYVYTATLYDENGNECHAVSYSVKSYVYEKQNDTTELGTLVRSLYNYGKSMADYAAFTE